MSDELKELETRTRGVETQLVELCTKFDVNTEVVQDLLEKHNDTLYGNGHNGLKLDTDRLKQSSKSRKKFFWMTGGALSGLIVKLVYEFIVIL